MLHSTFAPPLGYTAYVYHPRVLHSAHLHLQQVDADLHPPAGKVTVDTCTSSRSDCTPVLHLRSHCTLPLARERLAECSLGSVVKAIETKEVEFVCLPIASRNAKVRQYIHLLVIFFIYTCSSLISS